MTDPRNFLFNSNYQMDQIIGIFTNTLAISAPTAISSPVQVTDTRAHGFGDSAYFEGVFSSDGVTYNDFGSQTPDLTTPTRPTFQTLDCNATVDTTNVNITLTNYYDFTNSKGTAYSAVTYKVILFAKNTMASPITPIAVNNDFALNTNYNYLKIATQGSTTLTVALGATGSAVVAHNLGYVPKVRAFWFDAATPTTCQPISFSPNLSSGTGIDSPQVRIDTSNVTFYADESSALGAFGINGTIQYRIYYDS